MEGCRNIANLNRKIGKLESQLYRDMKRWVVVRLESMILFTYTGPVDDGRLVKFESWDLQLWSCLVKLET